MLSQNEDEGISKNLINSPDAPPPNPQRHSKLCLCFHGIKNTVSSFKNPEAQGLRALALGKVSDMAEEMKNGEY